MKRIFPLILAFILVLSMQSVFADSDIDFDEEGPLTTESEEVEITDIEEQDNGGLCVTITEDFPEDLPEEEMPSEELFDDSTELTTEEEKELEEEELTRLEEDVDYLSDNLTDELSTEQTEVLEETLEDSADVESDEELLDEDTELSECTNGIPVIQSEDLESEPEEKPEKDKRSKRRFPFNWFSSQLEKSAESFSSFVADHFATPVYAASTSKRTGRKTTYFMNGQGRIMWSVTIYAKYNYNGRSVSCKRASVFSGDYSSVWRVTKKSSNKYSNTARASATAKRYSSSRSGARVKQVVTKNVTLKCSKRGKLY